MFYYLKKAMKEAKKEKELDKKKKRLLSKDMDYQFLEELINRINENPQLNVRIELKDHTILEINAKAKAHNIGVYTENQVDFLEVR